MLQTYFDRVVCINLRRRTDRWLAFQEQLEQVDWPFRFVERFNGIDGRRVSPPLWFNIGDAGGTWGCLMSHLRVWEEALNDDLDSVLIFEDDAVLCDGFGDQVSQFLRHVPSNWDQLWIGGDHVPDSTPWRINEFVYRPEAAHRMHCYAMRRDFIRDAYRFVTSFNAPGRFTNDPDYHIDHQLWPMMRDERYGIYCPEKWLVGQRSDVSDIVNRCRHEATAFYNDVNPIANGKVRQT